MNPIQNLGDICILPLQKKTKKGANFLLLKNLLVVIIIIIINDKNYFLQCFKINFNLNYIL
jgi:hypothetical protein